MPYPPPMALGKVKGAMAMIWTNLNSSRNKTRIWMESTFAKNFYHRILSTARLDNCKKRFELAVVKSMIIFHKYTSHKRFRQIFIHELVQPLPDAKSTENVYPSSGPQPVLMDDPRLKGKHFPKSKYPTRKCCAVCGYKRKLMTNLPSRKPLL